MTCLSIGYISHDLSLNNAIFITWPVPALCFPTVYLFATLLTLWLIPYHSQCNRSLGILSSYLDLARQSSLSFKFTFKATGAKHGYITADLLIIKVDKGKKNKMIGLNDKGTETFKSMVASAQHTSLWQWDLPDSGRETETGKSRKLHFHARKRTCYVGEGEGAVPF